MLNEKTSAIIAAQKAEVKADIRYMLNRLVSMIETNQEKYSALVSDICNDLDSKAIVSGSNSGKDKYSLRECLVIRQAIQDQMNEVIASKQNNGKKAIKANVTNLRYIADASGKYHVVGIENGQEKIVFQTDNEQAAKDFVNNSKSTAVTAAEEPDDADIPAEDEFDDIPSERAASGEDEDIDNEFEDEENDALIAKYDEINELGNRLLSDVDNGINEVTQLEAVTDLAEVRVEIEDALNDLNTMKFDSDDFDEDELQSTIDEITEKLHTLETKAIDIIGKYVPGSDTETMGTDAKTEVDEALAASEIVEDDEIEEESDENSDAEVERQINEDAEELDDDFDDDLDFDDDSEDFDSEEDDFEDDDFDDEESYDEESDDAPDSEEITEALDNADEEGFSDEDEDISTSEISDLLDDLLDNVTVPGDKVEEVAEIKSNIEELLDSEDDFSDEEIDSEELEDFEDEDLDDSDVETEDIVEETSDELDFDEIDSEIEEQISPKEDLVDIPSPAEDAITDEDEFESEEDATVSCEVLANASADVTKKAILTVEEDGINSVEADEKCDDDCQSECDSECDKEKHSKEAPILGKNPDKKAAVAKKK